MNLNIIGQDDEFKVEKFTNTDIIWSVGTCSVYAIYRGCIKEQPF